MYPEGYTLCASTFPSLDQRDERGHGSEEVVGGSRREEIRLLWMFASLCSPFPSPTPMNYLDPLGAHRTRPDKMQRVEIRRDGEDLSVTIIYIHGGNVVSLVRAESGVKMCNHSISSQLGSQPRPTVHRRSRFQLRIPSTVHL
jgi:hypothetical protein